MALFAAYRIYFLIASYVLTFGAGWMAHSWKTDSDRLAQLERGIERANDASQNLENANEQTRTVYRTITQQVDKLVDRPIYRDRCFDDLGLQLANAFLAGEFNEPMPEAPTTERRDRRDNNTPDRDRLADVLRVPQQTWGAR